MLKLTGLINIPKLFCCKVSYYQVTYLFKKVVLTRKQKDTIKIIIKKDIFFLLEFSKHLSNYTTYVTNLFVIKIVVETV